MNLLTHALLLFVCATVAAEDWKFKVVQPLSSPETVKAEQEDYYVVMFTASWCGPCQQYKRSGQLDNLKSEFPVTVVDMDQNREWWKSRTVLDPSGKRVLQSGIQAIPSFWLCRKSDRWPLKKWTGSTSLQSIKDEVIKYSRQETPFSGSPAPAPPQEVN
jgi:thiol-disulfide isomerase/thioredoxin